MGRVGLSASDVVMAASSRAPDAISVGHLVGSLTPDKKAVLLIVDGDPTQDIAVLRNIDTIMLGGWIVARHDAPKRMIEN